MKVRYLIKFTKESNIKFISHLDLMRTIHRTVRRSGIKAKYSKGFNPHMIMSIAQPLSVGVYSESEYLDIELDEVISEKNVIDKLNLAAPSGIKFLDAKMIIEKENTKKPPTAMAAVEGAKYIIKIKYDNDAALKSELQNLYLKENWQTIKKSKKGEKVVDIKPMIKEFEYNIENNLLTIVTTVSCGSKENLSADLLGNFIKENTSNAIKDAFVDIKREELYGMKNNKLVPLNKAIV
ncbi:TIGR03936 family radical SAM-associated protein [uncultured Clostridium sp.]|mgnify:FL=1|uniref:TIGR03936 family radical SAM-associated protein n=1 Tax=uncultured Clostridium sp. TaxID=59620 RepID=UPI0025DBFAC8|nr:TIGR03936 family radical SAM-associated protein [uncultured Clostridium sp.]